ncbi:hypothetical protein DOO78_16065 [Roseicella frigidaeris]|uniref:DUF2946 domain-containing protein n=2 Tax=Roseicella frigidaeris TaxID=2230885 RepID=A0A327MCU3_9PROT|nr:hypothetical protein DOO78_16065 [Roseicella frigidaeris]
MARSWAVLTRLLAAGFLLACLLVPPHAEAGPAGPAGGALPSLAIGQDGGAGQPGRPDGLVHVGAHCACQFALRLAAPGPDLPRALGLPTQPLRTDPARASFDAGPPARPPRA